MKQKLILFSALLIIFLFAGTACAIEESENTDTVLLPAGLSVDFVYNGTYFRQGDVVNITATFNKAVGNATIKVDDRIMNMDNMTNINGIVWCYDYKVPSGIDDAVDVIVFANETNVIINETDPNATDYNAFIIDNGYPSFKRIKPISDIVNTSLVAFSFNAFDRLDNSIAYTLYVNETVRKTGTATSKVDENFDVDLADGHYKWKVELEDDAGNNITSDVFDLYVDTEAPNVTLVYPGDFFVVSSTDLKFNFTAQDNLSAKHNQSLNYKQYIDGVLSAVSGSMRSGEYIPVLYTALNSSNNLTDGVHNWSVSVEDRAGNNYTSEVRNLYVNHKGLKVELVSPTEGFVSANPEFRFNVSGGAGLPFNYTLLLNNTEVKNGTFVVGEDEVNYYSVNVTVEDAKDILWTVNITDCAGRTSQPAPITISVDTMIPAPVANLSVTDAPGNTTWYNTSDVPRLYVLWDNNTESDIADYVVYISESRPLSIEAMERVSESVPGNETYIGEYGRKPLVYGKDYWVAVVARDGAKNYDKNFTVYGPARTYEDMNLTLDAGWNLKSVPKRLASFNADTYSAFGKNSTVIYWNGNSWEFPTTIEPCKGYWVYTPEAGMRNVKFKPMPVNSTSPDVPASLDLAPGWQMIGHTSTQNVEWEDALGSLYGGQNVFAPFKFSSIITYSQNEGWGGITNLEFLKGVGLPPETPSPVMALEEGYMVPGQGYWIFMTEAGTYASVESVDFHNPT